MSTPGWEVKGEGARASERKANWIELTAIKKVDRLYGIYGCLVYVFIQRVGVNRYFPRTSGINFDF